MARRFVFGSLLLLAGGLVMFGFLERKMIYYPTRALETTPSAVGLGYEDVEILTADGVRIQGADTGCAHATADVAGVARRHGVTTKTGGRL